MTIQFTAGILPSGKAIIFKPDADLSDLDPAKLTTYSFEADERTVGSSIRANGLAIDALETLGAAPKEGQPLSPAAYSAAYRIALACVRCTSYRAGAEDHAAPDMAALLTLPAAVLEKYQAELEKADAVTEEDMAFFRKTSGEVNLGEVKPEEARPEGEMQAVSASA